MREALARRLADLEGANEALEDRQAKLATLQAELLQRERGVHRSPLRQFD